MKTFSLFKFPIVVFISLPFLYSVQSNANELMIRQFEATKRILSQHTIGRDVLRYTNGNVIVRDAATNLDMADAQNLGQAELGAPPDYTPIIWLYNTDDINDKYERLFGSRLSEQDAINAALLANSEELLHARDLNRLPLKYKEMFHLVRVTKQNGRPPEGTTVDDMLDAVVAKQMFCIYTETRAFYLAANVYPNEMQQTPQIHGSSPVDKIKRGCATNGLSEDQIRVAVDWAGKAPGFEHYMDGFNPTFMTELEESWKDFARSQNTDGNRLRN